MLVEPGRRRKSMAAPYCAVEALSENWLANRAMLIAHSQAAMPFAGVEWERAIWDVSEAYRHRMRGYKADKPVQRLLFTQHGARPGELGAALEGSFGDVVKSLVCIRHCQRGQSATSHMVFVRATRYVYEALADRAYEVSELSADHLDVAAAALLERECESSAYKVIGHMEEFADMLDRNGLCRLRLDWRYRRKHRPCFPCDGRCPDKDRSVRPRNRLPDDQTIEAIGALYQSIPRSVPPTDPASADRLMVLIATLMVCTGLRVGEVLTLPERPLSLAQDGSKTLRYARLKGRADDVAVEWTHKPLLTETEALVEEVLDELHSTTEGARSVARRYHESGELLADALCKNEFDSAELPSILGLKSDGVAQFLRSREIPHRIVDRRIRVGRADLLKGLLRDHWTKPVIPGAPGSGLALHEALCVVYANQMHRGSRTTLTYAARPITDQNVSDFLGGRCESTSIFERYEMVKADGTNIDIRSHGFRHFLNHLLDEGGAPDLVQTKWFGRKYAADTKAYQHMTSVERAAQVVSEIMGGRMRGVVPDIANALPADRAQTFLVARIHAVHDVGAGMCLHDFQMSPCPRHLQCTVDCDDYVWVEGEIERVEELKRQAAVVSLSLETTRELANDGVLAPLWLTHLQSKYIQLMTQLALLGFHETDLARYIKGGRDGQIDSC
ncbi:integrase [Paraburkholderia diazotrophica]|uniref:integrase n=1 Tax=Paraburkholderia diazotrophica TaxID=667676 RepID=UPI0031766F43